MRRSLMFTACAIVLASGCGKPPEPVATQPQASPAEVAKHMDDHFGKVREVQDAVIRGDLEAAKAPAAWLADHVETTGLPAGSEPRIAEMKAAARSVTTAETIGNAAVAAASLVGACGGCHASAKVTPTFAALSTETSKQKLPGHMLEHQHAIELMYRGLVSPANGEWRRGAEALKVAPLGAKAFPDVSEEAVAAEARVHELAGRAIDAPGRSDRVTIYGSLIGECASCHGLHGRLWGPGLQKTE